MIVKDEILLFIKNHKKSTITGLAQYLGEPIEEVEIICDEMHDAGELKKYKRSDGLIGVKLKHETIWIQRGLSGYEKDISSL